MHFFMKVIKNLFLILLFFCSKIWSFSPIEFQRAALNGDTNLIEVMLKEKGLEYVKLRDKDCNTPLHLAACGKKSRQKEDIISLLLKYGADVNATNKYHSTPLYIAVATNHLEGVKTLLKEPRIMVNLISSSNFSPLMAATALHSSEIISLLLHHPEIDPNIENSDGMTVLHLAAKWGYKNELNLLLDHPRTDPQPKQKQGDFIGATPLHYASMQAHSEIIKLLIEKKVTDVNAKIEEGLYAGFTPIHYVVMNPNTLEVFDCLKLLIRAGAQTQMKAKNGKLPSDMTNVRVILQFLANPNLNYEIKKKKQTIS